MKWIVVSGLPFTTIENAHLQDAFKAANPDARLQSARSLARKLEDAYDTVSERVANVFRNQESTIHYTHDSWTDTGRKNSYIGTYATYIDEHWQYKEVLVRLLSMAGTHSGERMGTGLFDLFHRGLGIAAKLGPGTADNASNNVTTADRLGELLRSELDIHLSAKDMIGCVCHIANLAALKYLEGEGKSTATV
jgi:hypothetical protein